MASTSGTFRVVAVCYPHHITERRNFARDEAAGVDEADHYEWLNGKAPGHYSTCVAIEFVLRGGLRKEPAG